MAELCDMGHITSSEQLASLVSPLLAATAAHSVADPCLRRLLAALSVAFSRRRSLLLLNLARQVQLHELPWAAPLLRRRVLANNDEPWVAKEALRRVLAVNLRAFPQTVMPNKLVSRVADLVRTAAMRPLPAPPVSSAAAWIARVPPPLEELAADIFEGRFSPKFTEAARVAAHVLGGTVYETYYGLREAFATARSAAFADDHLLAACQPLSGVARCASVAYNGAVIEMCQVLTSHNVLLTVAVLGDAAPVAAGAGGGVVALNDNQAGSAFAAAYGLPAARQTWRCILHMFADAERLPKSEWKARLRLRKDIAYAFRQMLLYVTVSEASGEGDTWAQHLQWARDEAAEAVGRPAEAAAAAAPAPDGAAVGGAHAAGGAGTAAAAPKEFAGGCESGRDGAAHTSVLCAAVALKSPPFLSAASLGVAHHKFLDPLELAVESTSRSPFTGRRNGGAAAAAMSFASIKPMLGWDPAERR